jgi:hypothetical protein
MSNKLFLKIKLQSLAAEARIIRRHESSVKRQARAALLDASTRNVEMGDNQRPTLIETEARAVHNYELYDQLRLHRTGPLRYEARAAGLAYGLVRGRAYKQIEQKVKHEMPRPFWQDVYRMASKYGAAGLKLEDVEAWRSAA